jgi:ADP-dependent NAD(P)H-hydrate dehydratase / NAD(P)H-hydrate epimerase
VRYAHTVAEVRAAEAAAMAVLPEGTLMARAATGLAVACAGLLPSVYGARVVLLIGSGNNGADALWAGAQLARRGAQVTAVPAGQPVADAVAALRAAGGRTGGVAALRGADLVVDGLVGIGGRGGLREEAAALVAGLDGLVVAVDLPSGVDADSGAVAGPSVCAQLTVTFGTLKPGLLAGVGRAQAGRVVLVDIGLGPHLPPAGTQVLEDADVRSLLPVADGVADKYSRGVVGVAAGSQQYTGAAVLCTGAAVRAGAGMVRFAGAPHAAEQVRSRWPEAVVSEAEGADVVDAGRVQAWVVGPGLGTDDRAAAVVEAVLAQDVPVLVDADALTVCAQHPAWLRDRTAPTLLTPHDREYARFGRDVGDDRAGAARALAADLGVHVLLKGDATVVAGPDGPVRVNATGSPVLATAGSGDVLSGGVGALLAQGLSPLDAGSAGAHLHGLAGRLSADGAPTSASALLEAWPSAVRAVTAGRVDE